MIERTVPIVNPTGLHARPAAGLTELARRWSSEITLQVGDKSANARSIISLLTLDLYRGTQVLLRVQGADEAEALDAVAGYLAGLTE